MYCSNSCQQETTCCAANSFFTEMFPYKSQLTEVKNSCIHFLKLHYSNQKPYILLDKGFIIKPATSGVVELNHSNLLSKVVNLNRINEEIWGIFGGNNCLCIFWGFIV